LLYYFVAHDFHHETNRRGRKNKKNAIATTKLKGKLLVN